MGHIMTEAARDTEGGVTRDRSAVLKSVRIGASRIRFTDRLKESHCVKSIRSQHFYRITHFKRGITVQNVQISRRLPQSMKCFF